MGADVESGINGLRYGIFISVGHLMFGGDKFYGLTVGNHIALESPFLSKNFGEEMITARDGFAVIVVVRTHYSQRTGFVEGHSKRIEIECAHFSGSYVGVSTCFSVTSAYRYAIDGKMFWGRDQLVFL